MSPKNKLKDTSEILLRNVPIELRNQFRSWCVARGMNMTAVLTKYMYDCVTAELRKTEKRPVGRPRKDTMG